MSKKTQMTISRPSKREGVKNPNISDFSGEKPKKTQLLIETTPEFKSKVKTYCASNNESVKDFIHRLIEQEFIRNN